MCHYCRLQIQEPETCVFEGSELETVSGSFSQRDVEEVGDVVANSTTNAQMDVGDNFVGDISFIGDRDWVRINLEEGTEYSISLSEVGGSGGYRELDTFLRLYDHRGIFIDSDDDGGEVLDSLLHFTANYSGVFYISAASYADSSTGMYSLEVQSAEQDLTAVIDWDYVAPTVINVHFVENNLVVNDGYGEVVATYWDNSYRQAAINAFEEIETFANISFNYVDNVEDADFAMLQADFGGAFLGYWKIGGGDFIVDGTRHSLDGWGAFNTFFPSWSDSDLRRGSLGYVTLIHEIGHGLGLAHTHDEGGETEILQGVSDRFEDRGVHGLNQGIWTTMSYIDGWNGGNQSGSPRNDEYGLQGTMMALDIAVLQEKYGTNMSANAGDDVYTLQTNGSNNTYYAAIWDTGGNDTIVSASNSNSIINLNDATLQYEEGGGGFVSYTENTHGGFTIANSVIIENATGGGGNDHLFGNEFDNILTGNAGRDEIEGGDGDDYLYGNGGRDDLSGGAGDDHLMGGTGGDTLNGGAGDDYLYLLSEGGVLRGGDGDDFIFGSSEGDRISSGRGNDIIAADPNSNFFGGSDEIFVYGGDNLIMGGRGRDVFQFSAEGYEDNGQNIIATFDTNTEISHTVENYLDAATGSDFQVGRDIIELQEYYGLNEDNVMSFVEDTEHGAQLLYQDLNILFYGVDAADLSADDFTFEFV